MPEKNLTSIGDPDSGIPAAPLSTLAPQKLDPDELVFVGTNMFCTPVYDNFAVTTTFTTFVPPFPVEREILLIERETNSDSSINVIKFVPCVDDTSLMINNEFYNSHVDLFSLLSEDTQHDLCCSQDTSRDYLDITSTLIKGFHFYDACNDRGHDLIAPNWFCSKDECYLWTLTKVPLFCF